MNGKGGSRQIKHHKTTMEEINADTGRQLAKDLNENHPLTVYGMATTSESLSSVANMTTAKVKSVTNKGCDISFVTCQGDLCEMHNYLYEFRPPLKSAKDLPQRLPAIYNQVWAPRISWLVTKPLALKVLIVLGITGYGTNILGIEGMLALLERAPRGGFMATVISNPQVFCYLVMGFWYVAVTVHLCEALWAAYHCANTLKMDTTATLKWFLVVWAVGYPTLIDLQSLIKLHEEQSKSIEKKAL
jgi:uncharacterized RDD family membrane protein YckC